MLPNLPISPLHLPYISHTAPLQLPYISPTSPLHLRYIYPLSPLHLPYISLYLPIPGEPRLACGYERPAGGSPSPHPNANPKPSPNPNPNPNPSRNPTPNPNPIPLTLTLTLTLLQAAGSIGAKQLGRISFYLRGAARYGRDMGEMRGRCRGKIPSTCVSLAICEVARDRGRDMRR